jgi:hypothetical protein
MNAIVSLDQSPSYSKVRLSLPEMSPGAGLAFAWHKSLTSLNNNAFNGAKNPASQRNILTKGESYSAAGFFEPAGNPVVEGALRNSQSSFKILISQVSMHLGLEWLQKLFSQIDSLLDIEEWDENDPVPALETARTFIRLLLVLKVNRKPGIGISNSGNLIAAWTTEPNRLTVECLPNDRVRWIVSHVNGGEIERAVGDGRIDRLRDLLQPYEPSVWFEYAE